LSKTLEAVHVADTVRKAMRQRNVKAPLVIHSDRGSQYVLDAYKQVTRSMILIYSNKGYPYDNACIESFHSLIKMEWFISLKSRITSMLINWYLNILMLFTIP
jgi:transposase InsO family protein